MKEKHAAGGFFVSIRSKANEGFYLQINKRVLQKILRMHSMAEGAD